MTSIFLITPTKCMNSCDLSIAIFLLGISLLVDDDFLLSSHPIELELGPPDSNGTPQNYELVQNSSGKLICEKSG